MLKKVCPWCGKKTTLSQLGRRPVKQKPRWYQFSRTVQVCPHCAGALKLGGKALWSLVFVLSAFLSVIGELLTGYNFLELLGAQTIGWLLLLIGFAGVFIFSSLEKIEGV